MSDNVRICEGDTPFSVALKEFGDISAGVDICNANGISVVDAHKPLNAGSLLKLPKIEELRYADLSRVKWWMEHRGLFC